MQATDQTSGASGLSVEEPLDPALERVRQKLARLMLVGIGTLLVGVIAVFGIILYRMNQSPSPSGVAGDVDLALVPGASLQDASLGPDGILLHIAMPDGSTQLLVLDRATGTVRLRVAIKNEDG